MTIAHKKSLLLFSGALIGLLALWWPTVVHWFSIVWTVDVFAHGLLVPLVSVVMIWSRRSQLQTMTPSSDAFGGLMIVAASLVWFAGAALDTAFLAHIALVTAIQGLVILVFGRALYRAVLFPMAFLFLAVPFGSSLIEPMQHATARIVIFALDLFGANFRADGVLIELPSGLYEVAQACAGVKFLFTSVVTGVLLANLVFESWQRRTLIIVTSIALPIVANAARVLGILGIAELSSQQFAKDVDHIIYGWVFLSMVLLALIAFAYHISDKMNDEPEPKTGTDFPGSTTNPFSSKGAKIAGGASLLLWIVITLIAPNQFSPVYREGGPEEKQIFDHIPDGLRQLESETPAPEASFFNADMVASEVYRSGSTVFRAQYGRYDPLGAGRRLFQTANRAAPLEWTELTAMRSVVELKCDIKVREMVFTRNNVRAVVWAADWVGPDTVSNSLEEKLKTLYARIGKGQASGASLVLTAILNDDVEAIRDIFSEFMSTFMANSALWNKDAKGEAGNKSSCAE